jgi:hypothetical protein
LESVDFSLNRYYFEGNGAAARLRVGVLIESQSIPRFVHAVLADIAACNFAVLGGLFVESEKQSDSMLSWSGSKLPGPLATYYRLYDSRERRLPDALESVDSMPLLSGVPRVNLYQPQSSAAAPGDGIDLILCFGSRAAALQLAPLARLGAWLIEYGRMRTSDLSSALLAEFSRAEIVVPVRVIGVRNGDEACDVVADVTLSTRSRTGLADNVSSVIWSLQHVFIQTLRKLHEGTLRPSRPAGGRVDRSHESATQGRSLSRAFQSARWILGAGARRSFHRVLRGPRETEWQIAIRRSTLALVEESTAATLREFKWLAAEPGHFWADPFLFEAGDDLWLFYEDYPYATGRAVISCGRLKDDGSLTDTRVVLDRPYHLSYPHVFEWNGSIWMLPETTGAGQVELYRCERFPDAWVLEKTLLPIRATDPTIALIDGRWWLFLSPMPVQGQTATMLLFCADSPLGPWREVPSSPVCTDAHSARGAGRIFSHEGALIRPSQDCARTYGYAVGFNRIDVISQDRYEETAIGTVLPRGVPGLQRVHTYNRLRDWEAIDGFRYARAGNL